MYSLLMALTALTTPALGEIFGDLRLDDKYLAATKLELTCGDQVASTVTDSLGTFRLAVKGNGKCTVSVTHVRQSDGWLAP